MTTWINLGALWKILVFGLIAGAGLPALFAAGLFSLSRGPKLRASGPEEEVLVGGSVPGMIGATACFLIVLAAVAWGVYEIYVTGHPSKH